MCFGIKILKTYSSFLDKSNGLKASTWNWTLVSQCKRSFCNIGTIYYRADGCFLWQSPNDWFRKSYENDTQLVVNSSAFYFMTKSILLGIKRGLKKSVFLIHNISIIKSPITFHVAKTYPCACTYTSNRHVSLVVQDLLTDSWQMRPPPVYLILLFIFILLHVVRSETRFFNTFILSMTFLLTLYNLLCS